MDVLQVLFKSDGTRQPISFYPSTDISGVAKSEFKLNDKDIASLPFYGFPNSRKRVFTLSDLQAHAKRKFEATGIPYPAMNSLTPYMTLKGRNVKDLSCWEYEHERLMNLAKLAGFGRQGEDISVGSILERQRSDI